MRRVVDKVDAVNSREFVEGVDKLGTSRRVSCEHSTVWPSLFLFLPTHLIVEVLRKVRVEKGHRPSRRARTRIRLAKLAHELVDDAIVGKVAVRATRQDEAACVAQGHLVDRRPKPVALGALKVVFECHLNFLVRQQHVSLLEPRRVTVVDNFLRVTSKAWQNGPHGADGAVELVGLPR